MNSESALMWRARVGGQLKKAKTATGMTYGQVDERAKLQGQQMNNYSAQKKVLKWSDLSALAEALGVPMEWLFSEGEYPNRKSK